MIPTFMAEKINLLAMNRNLIIIAVAILASNPLLAQHENKNIDSHSLKHKNIMGLFVGNTIITPSGFNLPTIGIEYVREVHKNIGIGLIAEVEVGSHIIQKGESGNIVSEVERESAFLVLPAVYFRVYKGLIVSAGYGVELEKSENLGLFKLSLEYKLAMKNKNWMVLPTLSWDHTRLFEGWVYGVNFAYVF